MTVNPFTNELKMYTITDRILFFLNVILAILIITLSQRIIQTQFGKASLTFGISMLGIITIFKVIRLWGR